MRLIHKCDLYAGIYGTYVISYVIWRTNIRKSLALGMLTCFWLEVIERSILQVKWQIITDQVSLIYVIFYCPPIFHSQLCICMSVAACAQLTVPSLLSPHPQLWHMYQLIVNTGTLALASITKYLLLSSTVSLFPNNSFSCCVQTSFFFKLLQPFIDWIHLW